MVVMIRITYDFEDYIFRVIIKTNSINKNKNKNNISQCETSLLPNFRFLVWIEEVGSST